MDKGWIAVWRKLRNHQFWQEPRRFSKAEAWLDLLMEAAYQDHDRIWGWQTIHVKRGQVLETQGSLAERWGWNRKTVRKFLRVLDADNAVDIRTSKDTETGYTIITIINYELYQGDNQGFEGSPVDIRTDIRTDIRGPSEAHPRPTTEQGKQGKQGKEGKTPRVALGLSLEEFLTRMTPRDREVVRQIVAAIASTRKTGRVSPSVVSTEVSWWSQHPQEQVLAGMRTYLAKGYAAEGKREEYLRGIIRNNQNGQGGGQEDGGPRLTPGWQAIRRAALAMTKEDLQP